MGSFFLGIVSLYEFFSFFMKPPFTRKADMVRKTGETDISVSLNIDGSGKTDVNTGYKFLDHMLTLTAWFGFFDLKITSKSDMTIQPDDHHIVEDVAITFGQCFRKAIGEMEWGKVQGIKRYASSTIAMDECLVMSAVDIYDRGLAIIDLPIIRTDTGDVSSEMILHFFKSFSQEAKIVLHIKTLHSEENQHHLFEAAFKSFGRTLDQALQLEERLLKRNAPGA
jgi:imidazoleglycerol-phosphate dehydratase